MSATTSISHVWTPRRRSSRSTSTESRRRRRAELFRQPTFPSTAYLQYSSGSTRLPTGVMISHRNLQVNFEQMMRSYFAGAHLNSRDVTFVSWLPFYHDMGLVLGICAPILGGFPPSS